jgi:hypothetical protein
LPQIEPPVQCRRGKDVTLMEEMQGC